jgi:hypothetical protein
MSIGSCSSSSPFSLATLRSLGLDSPGGSAAGGAASAAGGANAAPAGDAVTGAAGGAPLEPSAVEPAAALDGASHDPGPDPSHDLGVAKDIPRGSFLDLKV